MKALAVQVRAPVASFRRPLDHTYQRTLPLPPPTTVIGLAAAALGISTRELWDSSSPLRAVRVQVLAQNIPARATDLWTLLKIKSGKMERSPYLRELLFNADFTLLYQADELLLQKLVQAFRQPAYPLSLGREDELIRVESCDIVECPPAEPPFVFYGTILPGDLRLLKARPLLQEGVVLEPAVVERLPTAFDIDDRTELRHPQNPQTFTLLPSQVRIELEEMRIPVYRLDERHFVWLLGTTP
jgi:CRISPR-associated protein Cas5t